MLRPIAVSSALIGAAFLVLFATPAWGTCATDYLPCDDGQCIPREDWCDDIETCDDGSDEAYCKEQNWWGVSPNKCDKKLHFTCEDGKCWPAAARCDGTADCSDDSDENDCDSKVKTIDESEEKPVESDETKGESEETKNQSEEDKIKSEEDSDTSKESSEEENDKPKESSEEKEKSKESSEEEKDKSKESSEEEKDKSKESSEENGSDEATTKKETLTTKIPSNYDDYEEDYEDTDAPETSTKETTSALSWSSTPETDFYVRKMGGNGQKRQYSTQINVPPTRVYRPPPVRPSVQYPSRQFNNQYPTSRKPAVPYIGPTRPYTPRPYRYIGAQFSGQAPSPQRGRYFAQQPPYPPSGHRTPYYSQGNNYISSQHSANHHQRYRNSNGNNGRPDWRNGVANSPKVYGRQLKVPPRFYFRKNFAETFGKTNYPSVRKGAEWILDIRNASGGWGKETPRALIALSLVNNSFLTGSYENDLMQKFFQVHLGVNLLRNEPLSLNRLAMSVNALVATCQDPRDFQGWDLTDLIRDTIVKLNRASKPPVINPIVYLSLCLADRNLTHYEVRHLTTYLMATRDDEATRDMSSLALEALACHMQKEKHNLAQYHTLQKLAWNATSKILRRKKDDGSFGSVYSTALAAQALMSVNDAGQWDPEPTFRFLKTHQQKNGSFGNFLATYYVLPALSGRSLLHLRNTECNPPRVDRELSPLEILQHPGPKNYIRYSLHLGSPLSTGYTVQVLVPHGISFFDVMRVAAYENEQFKFSYEEVDRKINVYSIADLPNDPEQGLAWRLYVRNPSDSGNTPNRQQLYTGDIRELLPTPDQHVVFWYHPLGTRF